MVHSFTDEAEIAWDALYRKLAEEFAKKFDIEDDDNIEKVEGKDQIDKNVGVVVVGKKLTAKEKKQAAVAKKKAEEAKVLYIIYAIHTFYNIQYLPTHKRVHTYTNTYIHNHT